ncbi:MAG: bacillithiol biosynthesis deacetylase BshB1 [Saprospiraceae bacterium]|nr:bacillithiol biosynthesis deacetylase BshB1 [Saprospiraceae bacterium]MBK7789873.1 bacillithiol biosynthesis deacetylase BshB1 [Saprospiraceae bacterium]MBK8850842.1 bacillithiol biosynthesis deacetylase BshB1 [Saprospiraceae bacterium]
MVDILAFGVHPDDVELGCSGTLLKMKDLGYSFGIVDLTRGELGSRGTAESRKTEAENAAILLGAAFRVNLGMADGFFEINKENILAIASQVRKFKPRVVLANAIHDRHPDHSRAAKLVSDACFYSGLLKIELHDELGNLLAVHRPQSVYHYLQDRNLKADFLVDITPYMDKKIESILAFETQFNASESDAIQTPISSKLFFEFLYAKARAYGRDINVDYAEGFTVERSPGVPDIMQLL